MLQTSNINELNISEYNKSSTFIKPKYLNFFLERYYESFKLELDDFVKNIIRKKEISVTFEDCRKALVVCKALELSLKMKKSIKVNLS